LGALAALEHRNRTGRGQIVDSAIYEACFSIMESLVPEYQFGGHIRERTGAILPNVAPSNVYETSDGLLIIAANQNTVFERLAEAMGQPELARDPRFATHLARGDHQKLLDGMINDWTLTHTSAELQEKCESHGVPCGKIFRAPDMLEDPHYAAREAIISLKHPVLGDFKMQNVFPKLSETPGNARWLGPATGAHNDYVFKELLGYDEAKIEQMKSAKVI
jgi:crotonobetainyl-CoA:carnitine CoA-transferase CaiB-like acyl-CoA transferase